MEKICSKMPYIQILMPIIEFGGFVRMSLVDLLVSFMLKVQCRSISNLDPSAGDLKNKII